MSVTTGELPRPTNAELRILRVLWALGPSTVRNVYEYSQAGNATVGYTTVLKFLQIMHGKGLVARDDSHRAHVYSAQLSQDQTQRQMTSFLVDNVFDGSRSQLVLQALGGGSNASAEELAEIRSLLDRLEEGQS
jgi:predicted transcriptional regulator